MAHNFFAYNSGHEVPPYAPGAEGRLFALWRQAIAAQNYPLGRDEYEGSEAVAAIERFFPNGKAKLLFLGCGDGTEVKQAADRAHDAWGVTLNHNNVKHAKEHLGLENVYFFDAHTEMPQEWSETFDGVMGFQFMEHSPAPILMLAEVWRVLKPRGLAYFETPGPKGWTLDENPHHFTCPTYEQARGWLQKADFVDIVVEELGPSNAARHLGFRGRRP